MKCVTIYTIYKDIRNLSVLFQKFMLTVNIGYGTRLGYLSICKFLFYMINMPLKKKYFTPYSEIISKMARTIVGYGVVRRAEIQNFKVFARKMKRHKPLPHHKIMNLYYVPLNKIFHLVVV